MSAWSHRACWRLFNRNGYLLPSKGSNASLSSNRPTVLNFTGICARTTISRRLCKCFTDPGRYPLLPVKFIKRSQTGGDDDERRSKSCLQAR
jgi:hypothetical protein